MTTLPILAMQHRVYAAFALHAIAMGSLFPRIPELKAQLDVGAGALGLGLVGAPVGTLLALTFASSLIERVSFRRMLLAAIPLVAIGYALAVNATNPLALFVLLIPAGLLVGCVVILVATAVRAFLGGYVPAPDRTTVPAATSRFARPTGPILVLVGVTLSAQLMEGAGLEWSALYMTSVFSSAPFAAGIAVAVVAFSQAAARFVADGFVDRHSPELVGRILLCCLALGIVVVFIAASPIISLLGFALIGLGSSVIFPLAISAAAQRTDRAATVNVAALSQLSFGMFLIGPPLLGYVAEHLGLPWVFGVGMPLVVLSLFTVHALGADQRMRR